MKITGLFACTLLLVAHGSYVLAQGVDDVVADADSTRTKALEAQADLLSPISFDKAEKDYQRSADAVRSGKKGSRYTKQLTSAIMQFQKAARNAAASRVALSDVLDSRAAAEKVNAPELAVELWAGAEKSLKSAARALEQGRSDVGLRDAGRADGLYRSAELVAIKDSVMGEARSLLTGAQRLRVERSAPQTLAKARELLAAAEEKIEADRYTLDEAQRLADLAGYEARHAMHIAESVKQIKEGSLDPEGLILLWEAPLKQLAEAAGLEARLDEGYEALTSQLQSQLTGAASVELKIKELTEEQAAMQAELSRSKSMVTALEEELAQMDELLMSLESGRSQAPDEGPDLADIDALFTSDEALVLQSSNHIILRLVGLKFASNSAELPPDNPAVRKLEQVFALFPGSQVTIEGHTDSSGNDDENRRLSQARADSLLDYLRTEMGETDIAFRAIGYGKTRPVASNDLVSGRAQNRRIDVVILPGN